MVDSSVQTSSQHEMAAASKRQGVALTTRRRFLRRATGLAVATGAGVFDSRRTVAKATVVYQPRYIVASAMYGDMALEKILPQVSKCGASALDLWPKPHGSQWDEAHAMGWKAFAAMLERHHVRLGAIASYRFGPFGLAAPLEAIRQVGARDIVLVTTARGSKGLSGDRLKEALRHFVDQMQEHLKRTHAAGATVAIENHHSSLLEDADGVRWFADMVRADPRWGIAFAPHHLPQDAAMLAKLIEQVGPAVKFFYAQQHGMGSSKKLPKEQEMLQMPGRGKLDFRPIMEALRHIDYRGYVEIFMHPVPRGVPILPTADQITAEIVRSRRYLQSCLERNS